MADSLLYRSPPLTLVGLGRLELPTSPLSGVRSNHLSYRPGRAVCYYLRLLLLRGSRSRCPLLTAGGADRDRTDDLLNANQALSQLSYSPSGTFLPLSICCFDYYYCC
jgi:hypothetical protein